MSSAAYHRAHALEKDPSCVRARVCVCVKRAPEFQNRTKPYHVCEGQRGGGKMKSETSVRAQGCSDRRSPGVTKTSLLDTFRM